MKTFSLQGDTHLGRQFVSGVPLHRKGERERMIWSQFVSEVNKTHTTDYFIHLGDVFDKPYVSYDLIANTATVFNQAARKNPKTTFVILKGNHDLTRNLERLSAFDLFAKLLTEKNIVVVDTHRVLGEFAFFPYNPVKEAATCAQELDLTGVKIAFGHCDTNGFGSDHNVVPTKVLAAKGVTTVYTGHVHKPEVFTRDGVTVNVVGSMQPYAFGEQVDDTLYVEHTLETLKKAGDLRDKVVRVTLQPDELLEDEVDCLQLVVKRLNGVADDTPVVTLGDFDMETLFRQAFTQAGVKDEITNTLLGQYHELRLGQAD